MPNSKSFQSTRHKRIPLRVIRYNLNIRYGDCFIMQALIFEELKDWEKDMCAWAKKEVSLLNVSLST